MAKQQTRDLRPDASEARLLEATVGPGRYRVVSRRPLTIALGPRAYVPALVCAAVGFRVALGVGLELAPAVLAAAIAGAGLVVAVAAHEAGHLWSGRYVRGLVPRILLIRVSGGASIVEGRFQSARGAAVFAAGGPLASAVLTIGFFAVAVVAPWRALTVGFFIPAVANALLLAVNLLPVAPSDGYALFRSLLWAETGSRQEAERRAIAWSRVVLVFGLIVSLELSATSLLAAAVTLFVVATLTLQHHAVALRVERR
jgi:Zn-dependent protease